MSTSAHCPDCGLYWGCELRSHPCPARRRSRRPDVAWKWGKWTFGFWVDRANRTALGIDVGPLEIVWRLAGYRP